MRIVTGGNGADTTAATKAWLQSGKPLWLANLYLIGEIEDPQSLWLTDYESPLTWWIGTFKPTVITRGTVTSKIGLESQSLDITWSPPVTPLTNNVSTTSPYHLARIGYYDHWRVRVWRIYMPTKGDAFTLGASELFGGRIAKTSGLGRGTIPWTVNSWLDCVGQYVPTNVIELANTAASYKGATPPKGFSQIPQFSVGVGSSSNVVIGNAISPEPNHIFDDNTFRGGFLVFNTIPPDPQANPPFPGSTLGGVWAGVQQNTKIESGGTISSDNNGQPGNQFVLYSTLPWPPTPGVDTFYVSRAAPINQADGDYLGFPFVPSPEQGL